MHRALSYAAALNTGYVGNVHLMHTAKHYYHLAIYNYICGQVNLQFTNLLSRLWIGKTGKLNG